MMPDVPVPGMGGMSGGLGGLPPDWMQALNQPGMGGGGLAAPMQQPALMGEVMPPGAQIGVAASAGMGAGVGVGTTPGVGRDRYALSGPTAQLVEVEAWARADLDCWSDRNERFERDQDLYRLAKPLDLPRNIRDLVVLNDPRVLVDKVVRILARHPNVIDVPPYPGVDPTIAQKMENYYYMVDRAINSAWADGLNAPYRYDQAFYPVLRGWSTERTMLFPNGADQLKDNPAALFDHQVIDPANVYPFHAGGKIRRVTHAYRSTVGRMIRDPLLRDFLEPTWWDQDERSHVQVCAVYWEDFDGGWWHAIIGGLGYGGGLTGGGSLWIKPPTELGYNPWTILLCGGASYRDTPWDDLDYAASVGTGILDASAENQRQMNRVATRLMELLSQESNPAASIYTNTGEIKKLDLSPGGRNFFAEKDKIELHRTGPQMGDFEHLWNIFMQRARRAGLPDAFFSEYGGEQGLGTGMGQTILLAAGKDVLSVYADVLNLADARKYKKIAELYRDFGPNIPLPTQLPMGNGMQAGLQSVTGQFGQMMGGMTQAAMGQPGGQGPQFPQTPLGSVQLATLDAWEISKQGTYVEITRDDMTPQETAARINLAMAMADKKFISLETARKEYVKLKNPAAENLKVLNEAVYLDPGVIQMLIPLTLSETGNTFLLQLWMAMQNPMPGPGQEQPGQGGQPSTGPTNGNMPTQATPPAAMGNWMTNQRTSQFDPAQAMQQRMQQMITGGALGGAGGGGTPPTGLPQQRGRPPTPARRGY